MYQCCSLPSSGRTILGGILNTSRRSWGNCSSLARAWTLLTHPRLGSSSCTHSLRPHPCSPGSQPTHTTCSQILIPGSAAGAHASLLRTSDHGTCLSISVLCTRKVRTPIPKWLAGLNEGTEVNHRAHSIDQDSSSIIRNNGLLNRNITRTEI